MDQDRIRLAVLGGGTVGGAVLHALAASDHPLHGEVAVMGVAVRDVDRPRSLPSPWVCTNDPVWLAGREDVDVVVEAMGGVEPARSAVEAALRRGVDVVTANKALLAEHGPALQQLAERHGAVLRFEAAVAAALPIVALLRTAVAGDRVLRIEGVLSGTANHVLGLLEDGVELDDAVRDAQAAGFAEADPSRDIDGRDTVDKLVLLARLAFGATVAAEDVRRRGIGCLTPLDAAAARIDGGRLKLVARAERGGALQVGPEVVAADDPLASACGPGNVVRVVLEHGGELLLHGAGAGGGATASAVLRDLGELVRRRQPARTPVAV